MAQVAVIGKSGSIPEELERLAREIGKGLAMRGHILVCGGHGGVMESACRGAVEAGGLTVGIIQGYDHDTANEYVRIVIATGMRFARNVAVVASASAVIAIGGSWGTLSEMAHARTLGIPVISLASWQAEGYDGATLDTLRALDAEEALRMLDRLKLD